MDLQIRSRHALQEPHQAGGDAGQVDHRIQAQAVNELACALNLGGFCGELLARLARCPQPPSLVEREHVRIGPAKVQRHAGQDLLVVLRRVSADGGLHGLEG